MNLWLIPASDDASRANILKTLSAPISTERAEKGGIAADRHAWGARASSDLNVAKFKKMAPADWCLFYTQSPSGGDKKYHWKAKITETTRNRQISEALWDDPDFELVYFLENVQEVDITTKQLSAGFSEFRSEYFNEAPKGFTSVDPDVVAGIIEKYGSLEGWLAKLNTTKRHWIFQGNPKVFGVDEYIRTRDEIRWSVRQNGELIHTGDMALIWRSGENAGVIAVCLIQSEPDQLLPDDAPEIWHQKPPETEMRCKLRVLERFVDRPISREAIGAVLPNLNIIRAPQGTNFSLTQDEYTKILSLRNQHPESSLAEILRRYYDEQIIFVSSVQNQRYAIAACDDAGVSVERLDAHEPQRVTFAHAEKLIQHIRDAGDLELSSLDNTVAVRSTILQAVPLALSVDRKRVLYLPNNPSRLRNFSEVLGNLKTVNPLYKPAMLLCVVDGIDSGELSANRIPFDWIAPRFIAKLKALGEDVTEREAAQPFYHLTGDLIWLHAVQNRADLMQDGGNGPAAARRKVKHALLKDTYWNLLQDADCRSAVRRQLETIMTPKLSPAQLLSAAERAITDTGFVHPSDLVRRFVSSIAAKPFVILTGNSGTGKTKLAELFVQWLCHTASDRFALVPVGADWTDNRNVLGFVNHLRAAKTKEAEAEVDLPVYQTTKILDLLLDAARKENEGQPFFLILDEMNLSHVERYFADFLSAMESKVGRLLLHREGRPLPRKPDGICDVPESLALPRNVFVIGTVNVDETTYMFSPKVLDRANVIEFRVGSDAPTGFMKSGGQSIGEIAHAPAGYAEGFLDLSFRARSVKGAPLSLIANPNVPPDGAKEGIDKCRTTVEELFTLMQKRHQEFAFRSMAEILRFLAVDYELEASTQEWKWRDAMDAQVLQKILPKLHGSKRKIGSLLAALAKYCEQGIRTDAEALLIDETKAEAYLAAEDKREGSPTFKGSYLKLCEMIEAVRRDQFVSFIQ